MAVRTRVDAIDRDISVILRDDLSPKAQSAALAQYAGEVIAETDSKNASVLGRKPRRVVYVDGREGGSLNSVRPDGEIIAEYELFNDVLAWIGNQLEMHSPVKSGDYRASHNVFADGRLVDLGARIPDAEEYVFINSMPYARKIERGASSQAPNGVYQAVAVLAQRRFGNMAKVRFSFRTAMGGVIKGGREGDRSKLRNPAITVSTR